jgi:hypothetical protein
VHAIALAATLLVTAPAPCGGAAAPAADALAASFDKHEFVFIGSTHGDLKIEEFLMCLVTRPAFTSRVTDIVTEWASSLHQHLLDRYLLSLEPIPPDSLRPVWFDTDAPTLWLTLPQVHQFLEILREVNRTLPPAKRIRLVGGNQGVDWSKVKVTEDLAPYPFKTNLLPHLLVEHLAKTVGNHTLVVYGDGHIHYKGNNFMADLEAALGRDKLFVVGRVGELIPSEVSSIAAAGDPNRPFFALADRFPLGIPWPPSLRVARNEQSPRLADYMDAFVYLGPGADRSLAGTIPLTAAEKAELDRRTAINAPAADPQKAMRIRLSGKARWFSAHPNDLPPRP